MKSHPSRRRLDTRVWLPAVGALWTLIVTVALSWPVRMTLAVVVALLAIPLSRWLDREAR